MVAKKDEEVYPFIPSQLPKTIRILGKKYPVRIKRISGGEWGLFKGPQQVIELNTTFSSMDEAVDTLLHEIIHGIEYNNNLEYDEPRVRATATGLLAIIRDNPELVPLLQGNYGRPTREKRVSKKAV
jgi:hypothetical protein